MFFNYKLIILVFHIVLSRIKLVILPFYCIYHWQSLFCPLLLIMVPIVFIRCEFSSPYSWFMISVFSVFPVFLIKVRDLLVFIGICLCICESK